MSIINSVKILIKRGSGDPSTSLYQGELGIDTVNNDLYIGTGIGNQAIKVIKIKDINQLDASVIRIDANKLDNTTDTFTGKLTIDGSLIITGDIIQDGSSYETHAEQIYTTDDFIIMRDGALSAIIDPCISGIKVLLADGINNVILGTGNDAIMRIGWEDDVLVALAGREDAPTDTYYTYWDDSSAMFKTADLQGYIDTSLGVRDIEIAQHDASIIRIDASLGLGETTLAALTDTSIGSEINDQVLSYDTDGSTYMNKTLVDTELYSVVDASDYQQVKLQYNSPASDAVGTGGNWTYDASYLYICSSTNFWGKILLETGY